MKQSLPDSIVLAAQRGDHAALEFVFRATYDYLMGMLVRRASNYSYAEEALSATYETMLRRINRYEHRGKLLGWLSAIAMGELWHIERRERIRRGPSLHEQSAQYEHVEAAVFERIGTDNAATLLTVLTAQQREVLTLRYLLGFEPKDIATHLGMSHGAAKSAASKAVKVLRERIGSPEIYDQRPDRTPHIGVRNNAGTRL